MRVAATEEVVVMVVMVVALTVAACTWVRSRRSPCRVHNRMTPHWTHRRRTSRRVLCRMCSSTASAEELMEKVVSVVGAEVTEAYLAAKAVVPQEAG